MTGTWQLQEAKSRLTEIVEEAIKRGPQVITERGVEAVIVLSYAEYQRILANQQPLSAFFQESPLAGQELDLTRDQSLPRTDPAL